MSFTTDDQLDRIDQQQSHPEPFQANLGSFGSRRYESDGEFTVPSAMGTFLLGSGAGVASGILASAVGYYGFHIIGLVPMLMGLAVGAIMCKGIHFTKNRNPWVTAGAALLASFVAIGSMHLADYSFFLTDMKEANVEDVNLAKTVKQFAGHEQQLPQGLKDAIEDNDFDAEYLQMLQVESFIEYMQWQAELGISIGKPGRAGGVNIGYHGTIIYWLFEALIIAIMATTMVWSASKKPFCRQCDQWCGEKTLGSIAVSAKLAAKVLETDDVAALAREIPTKDLTDLKLYLCGNCGSPGQSVVGVERITYYNNKRQVKNQGYFVMSDESVGKLASLFTDSDDDSETLDLVQSMRAEINNVANPQAVSAEQADREVEEYMANLLRSQSKQDEPAVEPEKV